MRSLSMASDHKLPGPSSSVTVSSSSLPSAISASRAGHVILREYAVSSMYLNGEGGGFDRHFGVEQLGHRCLALERSAEIDEPCRITDHEFCAIAFGDDVGEREGQSLVLKHVAS